MKTMSLCLVTFILLAALLIAAKQANFIACVAFTVAAIVWALMMWAESAREQRATYPEAVDVRVEDEP